MRYNITSIEEEILPTFLLCISLFHKSPFSNGNTEPVTRLRVSVFLYFFT